MFVGHYAAALAVKSAEPRAPLWSYFTAAQLLDIGWGAFVIVGIEKMRLDPTLPGSVFDLYYMPWTHSLIAALAWSFAGALLFRFGLRLPPDVTKKVSRVIKRRPKQLRGVTAKMGNLPLVFRGGHAILTN